jgi:hypothetical protein
VIVIVIVIVIGFVDKVAMFVDRKDRYGLVCSSQKDTKSRYHTQRLNEWVLAVREAQSIG